MKCANYGCEKEAAPGWECCDKYCGWKHKTALAQWKKYQDGLFDFKDYLGDVKHYTAEQCNYYLSLLNK